MHCYLLCTCSSPLRRYCSIQLYFSLSSLLVASLSLCASLSNLLFFADWLSVRMSHGITVAGRKKSKLLRMIGCGRTYPDLCYHPTRYQMVNELYLYSIFLVLVTTQSTFQHYMQDTPEINLGFSVLPNDTFICRLQRPWIEPWTF